MSKRHYSQIELFCRSLLFSIYSLSTMAVYSFILVAAAPLPMRYRHALIRRYLYAYLWALRHICHINYKVEGLEHIPKRERGIIMSKHQSTWETFYLPTIFYDLAVIAKQELFWVPFFGWGLWLSGPIGINRKDPSSAMQQIISKGKKRLDAGRWVLVFPEGTRVPTGTVGNYRLGGARLAVATGYPIIPVAHNAGRFWPRRKFIKQPGTIHVVIGPAISSHNKTPEELLAATKQWIETTMQRIDAPNNNIRPLKLKLHQ